MAKSQSSNYQPRLRPVAPPATAPPHPLDQALGEPAPISTPEYREGGVIAEKYRLIRKVGEGGMGAVWVAHNEALDVPVAIKFIRAGEETNRHVGRLTQEARAAAKIGHPAILRVFDFGKTSAGDPFIVMELLHGEDLAAALDRRGHLPERKAVQILLPVLHALAVAHGKGIVHRDLKPDNIFLAETDAGRLQPKLVDFGVAKIDLRGFERLTQTGAVLGSPAYMSPEQARGRDVDPASDIWAACVVLYEMVSGVLPFQGDNYNALLWAILHDEPTPTSTHGGGDPRLWRIIHRGLAKDPRSRWPSMHELGRELAAWLFERGVFVDVAGASLQSTWLQRSDSGLDYLASSPSPANATDDWSTATVSESAVPSALLDEARSTATPVAARPRRHPWLIPVLFGVVLLLAGVAVLVVRMRTETTSTRGAASGTVDPDARRPAVAPATREHTAAANSTADVTETENPAPSNSPPPVATAAATPTPTSRAGTPPPNNVTARPPRKLKNPFEN